jgi:hypothetical protein
MIRNLNAKFNFLKHNLLNLIAFTAVAVAVFSINIYAAEIKISGAGFDDESVICTGSLTDGVDGQTIVAMVYNIDTDEIAYINQIEADKNGNFRLVLDMDSIAEGYYAVRLGGKEISKADEVRLGAYTSGMAVLWGDADGNNFIDANDAAYTLQYSLDSASLSPTPQQILAMDVSKEGYITANEAAQILQKSLNLSYMLPVEEE